VRLSNPRPTPNMEDQGIPVCLDNDIWLVRHGRPYQEPRYRQHRLTNYDLFSGYNILEQVTLRKTSPAWVQRVSATANCVPPYTEIYVSSNFLMTTQGPTSLSDDDQPQRCVRHRFCVQLVLAANRREVLMAVTVWRHAVWSRFTYVSEEHTSSISPVSTLTYLLTTFGPEHGTSTFLRNIGRLPN
jgi:hypothetical protein